MKTLENRISSREVAEMVEKSHGSLIRNIRNLIKRNPECSKYFMESTYKDERGKANKCYLLTKQGCELLLFKYKLRAQAGSLETRFIDGLEEVLKPFKIEGIRQYSVYFDNIRYRIDYYIQTLNIGIESDENGHTGYTSDEHEGRQKEIERALDCKFIRVTDKETDLYNIGLVIKEIVQRMVA